MIARIFLMSCALLLATASAAQPPVEVTDEWIRATPPGSRMTAGYLVLHNSTARDIAITSISSPAFELVEIHRTTMTDGVARMEKVDALTVPAGEHVDLAPGGLHLMLIGLRGALEEGGTATLYFVFDDGWELEVEAPVRRR